MAEPRRIFEMYVDSLEAERDLLDELLIVHLRYFGEDIAQTAARLTENPRLANMLVQHLSTLMQELDSHAGGVEALTRELGAARRWALLVPGPSREDLAEATAELARDTGRESVGREPSKT